MLLSPGCHFIVTGVLNQGDDFTIVHVEELPSDSWIMDLRGPQPEPEAAVEDLQPAAARCYVSKMTS